MRKLSKLQESVFAYMVEFFADNDQLPPVWIVAAEYDKYENQIHEMLLSFEKRGMIERNAVGKWRFSRANAAWHGKKLLYIAGGAA